MNSETDILKRTYALIAELWCSPQDTRPTDLRNDLGAVVQELRALDEESSKALGRFAEEYAISEEEYVDLFELEPKCSLYLGSHVFDEPKTCAQAAVSDRNAYMIELSGVYRHFGFAPNGKDLPDYLPMMVDFLSLTAQSGGDPVREKLLREYILPYFPPLRKRLEETKPSYVHLLEALERIVNHELRTRAADHRPSEGNV